ncbi:MAG: cache domain-containing protein, partial [Bacteroidetes bacterium]|nr:cache domain-containing protein [Bacteroidota bacterium]
MNAPGSRIRFILKTLLPALLAITLYIAAFFIVLIPQFEETVHGRKREMIRELTHSAWGILSYWHQQEAAGLLTRQRAQQEAVSQVEQLRYGADRKDYFWITDTFPVMVMHPYRPDLNGQDLSDMRDSSGKLLFVEMARVVRSHGEGYVDYT